DFGISKVKNASLRLTQERMMIGTPHYMSPEQARSQEVDERADQFALAAIAYELLSGELAFAGDNVPAVVYQVVHGEPPRLADAPRRPPPAPARAREPPAPPPLPARVAPPPLPEPVPATEPQPPAASTARAEKSRHAPRRRINKAKDRLYNEL